MVDDHSESPISDKNRRGDLSGVRAIYFDLDDTLCGYWNASKVGLHRAFELHGPEGHHPGDLIKHWAAAFRKFAPGLKHTGWYDTYLKNAEPTRTEQMRLMLERLEIEDPERASLLSQAYMEERDRALKLFPDAIAVIEALHASYPLGLITNGPADVQRQEINTLGIEHYFKNIFIEGEMGEGKPLKGVFDRAAATVGCQPHELLMVGNSYSHDIRAALDFGWHAVWVRRDSDVPPSAQGETLRPEEFPSGAPEPDAIIGELSELLALLGF